MISDLPTPFLIFLCIALAFIASVFVFTILGIVKGRRTLLDAGINPLTAQAQLAAKLMNSEILAPTQSLEQRLTELDDLHRRGVISSEEHATARAKALVDG